MEFPLNLHDLVPKKVTFHLSTMPEDQTQTRTNLTLCRWSLRVRAWATEKYTSAGIQDIFVKQEIGAIADIAWFMLEEKALFPKGKEDFLDSVASIQDQINIMKALLGSLGIGEPEIEKINAKLPQPESADSTAPKKKAPSKKTGAKSLTP